MGSQKRVKIMKITEFTICGNEEVSVSDAVVKSMGNDQELTVDMVETFGKLIEVLVEKDVLSSDDLYHFISFDKYNIEKE